MCYLTDSRHLSLHSGVDANWPSFSYCSCCSRQICSSCLSVIRSGSSVGSIQALQTWNSASQSRPIISCCWPKRQKQFWVAARWIYNLHPQPESETNSIWTTVKYIDMRSNRCRLLKCQEGWLGWKKWGARQGKFLRKGATMTIWLQLFTLHPLFMQQCFVRFGHFLLMKQQDPKSELYSSSSRLSLLWQRADRLNVISLCTVVRSRHMNQNKAASVGGGDGWAWTPPPTPPTHTHPAPGLLRWQRQRAGPLPAQLSCPSGESLFPLWHTHTHTHTHTHALTQTHTTPTWAHKCKHGRTSSHGQTFKEACAQNANTRTHTRDNLGALLTFISDPFSRTGQTVNGRRASGWITFILRQFDSPPGRVIPALAFWTAPALKPQFQFEWVEFSQMAVRWASACR